MTGKQVTGNRVAFSENSVRNEFRFYGRGSKKPLEEDLSSGAVELRKARGSENAQCRCIHAPQFILSDRFQVRVLYFVLAERSPSMVVP